MKKKIFIAVVVILILAFALPALAAKQDANGFGGQTVNPETQQYCPNNGCTPGTGCNGGGCGAANCDPANCDQGANCGYNAACGNGNCGGQGCFENGDL